jgi:hypothetical protein
MAERTFWLLVLLGLPHFAGACCGSSACHELGQNKRCLFEQQLLTIAWDDMPVGCQRSRAYIHQNNIFIWFQTISDSSPRMQKTGSVAGLVLLTTVAAPNSDAAACLVGIH